MGGVVAFPEQFFSQHIKTETLHWLKIGKGGNTFTDIQKFVQPIMRDLLVGRVLIPCQNLAYRKTDTPVNVSIFVMLLWTDFWWLALLIRKHQNKNGSYQLSISESFSAPALFKKFSVLSHDIFLDIHFVCYLELEIRCLTSNERQ